MKVVYDETPEEMVVGVAPLLAAGADIVGACCGSTPAHIRVFRAALDQFLKTPAVNYNVTTPR
jgi:5-methyltetrahydrofolate--homocysteine methyltransferase